MVVILAEGAANKRRTSPCERLELIVAGIHIFDDLLRRQRIVVVVCVGMVHQLAAAVYDGLGLLRILVRPVADHEKGRLDAALLQRVEKVKRIVARAVVKRNGHQLCAAVLFVFRRKGRERQRKRKNGTERQTKYRTEFMLHGVAFFQFITPFYHFRRVPATLKGKIKKLRRKRTLRFHGASSYFG